MGIHKVTATRQSGRINVRAAVNDRFDPLVVDHIRPSRSKQFGCGKLKQQVAQWSRVQDASVENCGEGHSVLYSYPRPSA